MHYHVLSYFENLTYNIKIWLVKVKFLVIKKFRYPIINWFDDFYIIFNLIFIINIME